MIGSAVALALSLNPSTADCRYDRERLLSLSEDAFDQDLKGGWRAVADDQGCQVIAADLLRDYRRTHHSSSSILFWHEGQLRAQAGQARLAVPLLLRAKFKEPDAFGWNFYVDGTVAFLRHDRKSLAAARAHLASMPRPRDFKPMGPDGKPVKITWPPNLEVLDGLIRCFRQSYWSAYGPMCRRTNP